MNVEGFKLICQPGKDDPYQWLSSELKAVYGDLAVCQHGYIFCHGNGPVGLSAHIDTVFKQSPLTITESNGTLTSPQGIGGDDRCGIYGVLDILTYMKKDGRLPYIFLSTDEEVGGSTTKKMAEECKNMVDKLQFIIALDRAGSVDSVYYECDNKDFKKWIDAFGFVEAKGTRTDICTLCDVWDVAGVNFSVGYYRNHSKDEYVVVSQLEATLNKCHKIVDAADPDKVFPFYRSHSSYNNYYDRTSNYFPSYFMKDDRVFTKQYECRGYEKPRVSGAGIVTIPPYTELTVEDVDGSFCKITYNNVAAWVSSYNLLADIR